MSNKSYSALRIIENKGQWDKQVFAECDITHGKVWFTKTGILYQNYNGKSIFDKFHQHNDTITGYEFDHIYLDFIHSNKINSINKETPSKCYYNYFQGNDSTKWATKCHSYQKITYPNLWDGIDFIIEPDGDALKYSFRVKKGANSNLIKLTSNKSAEQFYLSNNKVHLKSKFIDLTEDKPFTFYEGFKDSKFIQSKFKLENGILSFELGNYNQDKDIIIDPTLIFGTYSGSTADNFGYTGTYDHSGHAYSGGSVYATGFPATRGQTTGFQTFYAGGPAIYSGYDYGIDAGILKYSEDGTQLLWASYLGGKGNDQPHSMIADRNGNLLVYGTTSSTDFPGAVDKSSGGYDIYITRISGDGIKVIKTRLLGGASNDGINALDPYSRNSSSPLTNNYGDPFRGEIIIDSFGKVWISSCTQNSIGSTIPQKKNWKIGTYGGDFDAYFASFSEDLSTLEFATVFGGTANDAGYGINLDVSGNVFFSGGTQGFNLITNKPIEKNSYNGGIADGFLIKMDRTTYNPLAIRYVGTSNYDQAYFVQIDNRQRIYTTGQTMGDFPVKGNVYTQKGGHQFIAAFDNNLSNLEFSTVFGQNTQQLNLSPSAFLVDLCGRICLSGWGGGANIGYTPINGTTLNLPTTQDAFQSRTDGADFYLAVFSPELTKLTYATYYGGKRSEEHVDGGTSRFDRDGKVYQSVCGGCGGFNDFPSTPNAWSRTNNGKRPYDPLEGGCNNAIFKMDLNSSNFAPALNDTTLITVANASFSYTFEATDQDVADSITITAQSKIFNKSGIGNPASIVISNGIKRASAKIYWRPDCTEVDTFVVNLTIRDNGCPTPRQINRTIRIIVTPPPRLNPPGIFCLKRINPNELIINWSELDKPEYTKQYLLFRKNPDSSIQFLSSFTQSDPAFYIDSKAYNHRTTDYKYFIYGINICGKIGDTTRLLSSIPNKDSIPLPIYLHTVTVEQDSFIKIDWNKNPRPDFYKYTVLRKLTNSNQPFVKVYATKDKSDTVFLDYSVDVHHLSYQYKVMTSTQCGISSEDGNIGTSILLTGSAVPFQNNLNWNTYQKWQGDVDRFVIQRQDSTAQFFNLDSINGNKFAFEDSFLNINWGNYRYVIKAIEGSSGNGAVSVSNTIKLFQKPLLYVPNSFTPNGDGINDVFNYRYAFVKNLKVKVFNKWGEQVWSSTNKYARWDGLFKGNKPFNNVFIWQADYTGFDDSEFYQRGNVTTIW